MTTKKATEIDRKATNTAFILMFPMVILAILAAYYSPTIISLVAVALGIYQFIMTKRFIEDFYRREQ